MKRAGLLALVAVLALTAYSSGVWAHGGRPLSAIMIGSEEVPPGDPDGIGVAELTFNPGLNEVCWHISVMNIALPATAAHIHRAPAGVAGPVVVPLSPPDSSGMSSGCRAGVDRDLILDIMHNPQEYYVNVHNADYPAGAVRGQLGK